MGMIVFRTANGDSSPALALTVKQVKTEACEARMIWINWAVAAGLAL